MSKEIKRTIDLSQVNKRGKLYDWKNSIGLELPFQYGSINSVVKILDYNSSSHMLTVSFPYIQQKIDTYEIHSDNFKKVKFGSYIDSNKYYTYQYDVGDVVKNNMGDITIMQQKTGYVGANKNIARRFYIIKCNRCGNIRKLEASHVHHQSHQYCNKCGIHTSYPEKFVRNFLDQLNINYTSQYSSYNLGNSEKRYLYDYYIPKIKTIIEVNGEQHYVNMWSNSKYTLEEIKENDCQKREFAINNGIINYCEINCSKSSIVWIKQQIMNSQLPDLLGFTESDIDWNQCDLFATSDYVMIAAEMFNDGYTKKEIGDELLKAPQTINNYLKKAYELHMIDKDSCVNLDYCVSLHCCNTPSLDVQFQHFQEVSEYIKSNYNISICSATIRKYLNSNISYKGFIFSSLI